RAGPLSLLVVAVPAGAGADPPHPAADTSTPRARPATTGRNCRATLELTGQLLGRCLSGGFPRFLKGSCYPRVTNRPVSQFVGSLEAWSRLVVFRMVAESAPS